MKSVFEFVACSIIVAIVVIAVFGVGVSFVSLIVEQPQEYEYIVNCPNLEPLHVFAYEPRYNEAPYLAIDFDTGNKVIIPQGCVWIEVVK